MNKVIGFVTEKGGVSKTMSSVNMAHILAVSGYHVLFIDLDAQMNATDMLMIGTGYECPCYTNLLCHQLKSADILYEGFIYESNFDLIDCIPGSPLLKDIIYEIHSELQEKRSVFTCLRRNIELVREDYDYVVIDTNPGDTTLTRCAICACDGVLSPIKADNFSFSGVTGLLQTIIGLKQSCGVSVEFMGMFFADVSLNSSGYKRVKEWYEENYSSYILPVAIRHSVQVSDSTLKYLPLLVACKRHGTTDDYIKLVRTLGLIDDAHNERLEKYLAPRKAGGSQRKGNIPATRAARKQYLTVRCHFWTKREGMP